MVKPVDKQEKVTVEGTRKLIQVPSVEVPRVISSAELRKRISEKAKQAEG